MFEVIYDTSSFNDPAEWPADGSQPFVWSFGDGTGYANHADYVFGWKDDSLQKILDTPCYVNCQGAKTQSIEEMNKCSVKETVVEDIDGCKFSLPCLIFFSCLVLGWSWGVGLVNALLISCVRLGLDTLPGGHVPSYS
jgi:hypothetical protein